MILCFLWMFMCYDVRHPFEFQLFRLFFAQKFYIWQLHRFFLLSRAATVYILNGLVHFMYVWNPLNIRNVWVNPSTNFIPTRWTFKYGKIVTRATTTTTKSLKLSFTPSLPLSHDFLWMRIKKIVNNIIYVTKLAIYIFIFNMTNGRRENDETHRLFAIFPWHNRNWCFRW